MESSTLNGLEKVDLLIVGGGIVGAGVARDAAMRGLKTYLIDQQDFSAGTSSRSSRLLHGGIRYLAQARLGLVWEASREKSILYRIAPHLCDPLAFLFPTRKRSSWSFWKLSVGVRIYDLLCGRRNLGKSRSLDESETLKLLPGLERNRLTGAVRYYDGLTNDARLVLDTLRSARLSGATVSNYVRFIDAEQLDGYWQCQLEQVESTGKIHHTEVLARCIVNATGPWSHQLPHSKTSLRLSKGVHLVIDRSRLPVPDAVVITEGKRILFAIPWGERVILGTTDTDYDGPVDSPTCSEQDESYVLEVINRAFPSANLSSGDIHSAWSGLRPLVADRRGNPSDISRRHEIKMSHPGWWDVTGGKLTTYRLMAEETVNQILEYLGVKGRGCETSRVPLLSEGLEPNGSGILPPEVTQEAVRYYCDEEWAVHLDDVMIRRTSWRYYHLDHLEIAPRVARWMQDALGWTEDRTEKEMDRYKRLAQIRDVLSGTE